VAALDAAAADPGPGAAAGPGLACFDGRKVRRASVLTTAYSISDVNTNSRQMIIQMSIACVQKNVFT